MVRPPLVATRDRAAASRSRAVTAVLATVISGCSLIAVSGPPPDRTRTPIRCTHHHAGTVVDAVIGAPAVVVGGWLTASPTGGGNGNGVVVPVGVFGMGFLLVGLTYLASAVVGSERVEACQAARQPTPAPALFCTRSPVSASTCYCAHSETDCSARQAAIVTAGGTMAPCVASPIDCDEVPAVGAP